MTEAEAFMLSKFNMAAAKLEGVKRAGVYESVSEKKVK